jgi:hypothetical protein
MMKVCPPPTLSQHQLMKLSENKYKVMKEVHEWQSPDNNDEDFIALQAQFQQLSKKCSTRKRILIFALLAIINQCDSDSDEE